MTTKESKIESKRVPSYLSQKICWICHQTDRIEPVLEESENFLAFSLPNLDSFNLSRKKIEKEGFKPCLCKGSLENVHKECLNTWALKKYQNYLKNFSEKEEEMLLNLGNLSRKEFKIKCPNCKYPLKYNIVEKRVLRSSHFFTLDTKEKFTLFLLIMLQVMFLFFDLRSLYRESLIGNERWSFTENTLHILYLGTVLIILSAGTINLLDLIGKEITLEVLNKD